MQPLYLENSYQKEFAANVIEVNNNFVVLDNTVFYPNSGGQSHDVGTLVKEVNNEDEVYDVIFVKKSNGRILHEVTPLGLKVGDVVSGKINWERRYMMMRMHTAAHILSAVINKETKALITGNQLDVDKSRIDFDIEKFEKEKILEIVQQSNEIIKQGINVEAYYLSRKEAEAKPNLARLAMGLPQGIENLRIIKIGEVDEQADGGTHVASTGEIGKIEIIKTENKGKNNRRLYFTVL